MSRDELIPLLFFGLDDAYARLRSRLGGLTDAEYLWEPVADCWSVRDGADGWRVEVAGSRDEEPEPAPITTIAWRLWHVASWCLAEYVTELGDWPLPVRGPEWFGTADAAVDALERSWTAFHDRLHALGEDGIRRPLGDSWGPFAENSWAELGMHAMDELAHHGAEIALLRDLYLRAPHADRHAGAGT